MNQKMTFVEHLSELRSRLTRVLLLFLGTFILGFLQADRIIQRIQRSAAPEIEWNVFHITDAVRIYLQVAFLFSLILTIPYLAFELWCFIAPGLHRRERQIFLPVIPASGILFVLGCGFGYTVIFPLLLRFMTGIGERMGITEVFGIAQYFSFLFNVILPFGVLFEWPLAVWILTRMGLLSPVRLKKWRKAAYLLLIFLATAITPPDLVSDLLVTIPLILLYEFSLGISYWIARRQERIQRG